jgi:hypothetical protein
VKRELRVVTEEREILRKAVPQEVGRQSLTQSERDRAQLARTEGQPDVIGTARHALGRLSRGQPGRV